MPPVRTIAFPCRGVLTAKHRAAAFPQCAFPFFLPIPKSLFAPCHPPHSWCVLVYSSAARGFFGLFARCAVLHFPLGQSVFFSPPHRFILFATPPAAFSGCSPAALFNTFTRESFCSRFPRLSRSPRRVDFSAFAFGVLCFLRRRCFTAAKSAVKKGDGKIPRRMVCLLLTIVFPPLPLCRDRLTPHYFYRQSRRFKFRKMRPAAAAFPAVRLRLARTRSTVAT